MSVSITLDHGNTFTQWDTGRFIYVNGYTENSRVKVHFTTSDSGVAFSVLPTWVDGKWKAGVPNTVLTVGLPVNIYVYDEELMTNRTVYKFVVGIDVRSKPADYIFDAYERNTLQWPYEENIEEILRGATVIFDSEESRQQAEITRQDNESVRTANEVVREDNENTRQRNEDLRNLTLQELQQRLEEVQEVIREVTSARSTYPSLGDRLDEYPLSGIVSSIIISPTGDITVEMLDGTSSIIGNISSDTEGIYIVDISRTGGTGLPGSTDQYTITLNNGDVYTFNVYNGRNGATFIPSMAQDGTLSWSNNGDLPNPAPMNLRGSTGYTFIPSIDSSGNLSWSNNGGLPNPQTINIKGESGEVAYMYTPHVSQDGTLSWTNDGGMPNPDPVVIKGNDGTNGYTFVPSIDENGVLSWSNNGGLPNPPTRIVRGANGEDGTTFIPSVNAAGDISWSNEDGKVNPETMNIKGPQGVSGVTFTPSVDANGNLSWSNTGGLPNPQTINIRGPQGIPGSGGDADTLDGHAASYFATADHTHNAATQSAAGFMSATDKTRLDAMTGNGTHTAQDVGSGSSPTFNIVNATKIIGAVYA